MQITLYIFFENWSAYFAIREVVQMSLIPTIFFSERACRASTTNGYQPSLTFGCDPLLGDTVKVIKSNTTWSGTIVLNDDYRIASGVTLTIAAGSEIHGNGFDLDVQGSLNATGTAARTIFMSNLNVNGSMDYGDHGKASVSYTHIDGGSLASGSSLSILFLQNSTVTNSVSPIKLRHTSGLNLIANNTFVNSSGIMVETGPFDWFGASLITDNIFDYQSEIGRVDGDAHLRVHRSIEETTWYTVQSKRNAFLDDNRMAIKVDQYGTAWSENDWYDTKNITDINKKIYDSRDSKQNHYEVSVSDSLTSPSLLGQRDVTVFTDFVMPKAVVRNVVLAGTADGDLTGNALNNALSGNKAANVLDGGAGNDSLKGGFGNDTLFGGSGRDNFVFDAAFSARNVDHIKDFSSVSDTIHLDKAIFKALPVGGLADARFKDITDGAKIDSSDRVLYNHDTGAVSYDVDGSGSAKAVVFAVLDTHPIIKADDFFVI